jgi:hypothetical protein
VSRVPVELRILQKGSRRQAQYRLSPATSWKTMYVGAAEKALRDGKITLNKVEFPVVVSRETRETPVYPHAADFSERAVALNDSLNSMFATGGAA